MNMYHLNFLIFTLTFVLETICAYDSSSSSSSDSSSCIYPTGFGNGVGEVNYSDMTLPSDGLFTNVINIGIPEILKYETPIQFHKIQLTNIVLWGAGAAFDDKALDHWGRVIESTDRRRCNDSLDFDAYRQVTYAYALYFAFVKFFPQTQNNLQNLYENVWNVNVDICNDDSNFDCYDTDTPWGLAYVLREEVYNFSLYDGWNSDGSLSRSFNKIPYQDFRDIKDGKYIPQNSPWILTSKDKWQPLLESDELGFLFYQEFVTPHIGFTGKSILLGDEEICSRVAPQPNYNYDNEIEITFDRMTNLTDKSKVAIELFDAKPTSLVPFLGQFYVRQGISLDSFEFAIIDSIIVNILYEATIVVWKEKVNFDAVRPTSIVHDKLDGEFITSYAGTTADGETLGTQTFLANDWEPYIRTMPHAEYPSGSSCVCKAFGVAMKEFTGSDSIVDFIGGPLVYNVNALSSFVEPLSTPGQDITLLYYTWSEVVEACSQSRLDGGMHFEAAVPAGQDLCGDIGSIIVKRFEQLVNGIVPDYVVDINDHEIRNRDC